MPTLQRFVQSLSRGQDFAVRVLASSRQRIPAKVNGASYRLDMGESIQRAMFLGQYETTQTAWTREILRPGDAYVDAGASFGYYTTLAAQLVGPTGKVFAFEPSPVAADVLSEAIKTSKLSNVTLTRAALGSTAGTLSLFLPTLRGVHSPSLLDCGPGYSPVKVPVITLDGFHFPATVRLLKLDVEGFEPNVLLGMRQLAAEGRVENIICELNSGWLKRNDATPDSVRQLALELGFRIERETEIQYGEDSSDKSMFSLQDIWLKHANI